MIVGKKISEPDLANNSGSPIRQKMLVFGRPVLDEAEFDEVLDKLRSGWILPDSRTG